jgi:hypothetical protein
LSRQTDLVRFRQIGEVCSSQPQIEHLRLGLPHFQDVGAEVRSPERSLIISEVRFAVLDENVCNESNIGWRSGCRLGPPCERMAYQSRRCNRTLCVPTHRESTQRAQLLPLFSPQSGLSVPSRFSESGVIGVHSLKADFDGNDFLASFASASEAIYRAQPSTDQALKP